MSQRLQIKRALQAGKKISALTALRDFKCMRLAARILELRQLGMDIETVERRQNGKLIAVYRLRKDPT